MMRLESAAVESVLSSENKVVNPDEELSPASALVDGAGVGSSCLYSTWVSRSCSLTFPPLSMMPAVSAHVKRKRIPPINQ